MLILVEWRSGKWPRYRRTSIGVGVFVVNSAVLVVITAMFTLAMMAASALFHARGTAMNCRGESKAGHFL